MPTIPFSFLGNSVNTNEQVNEKMNKEKTTDLHVIWKDFLSVYAWNTFFHPKFCHSGIQKTEHFWFFRVVFSHQTNMETTEDEMVGWCHWLNGHEFEQTPGDGEGQVSLVCCSHWGHRVGHDWATEQQQIISL